MTEAVEPVPDEVAEPLSAEDQGIVDGLKSMTPEERRGFIDQLSRSSDPTQVDHVQGLMQRVGITTAEPVDADDAELLRRETKLERAKRKARRIVDAEEAAAERGPRVKRSVREYALLPQVPAIIDSVLACEVNLLAGPSASGKSLLTRDWALHVAAGVPWRGYSVPERRSVLLVLSEGLHDVERRWTTQPLWNAACDNVFIQDQPISLLVSEDVDALLDEYKRERPGLVIFDLIYAMGLTSDDGQKDVQPLIGAMKKISATWGAATLAVGHTGHATDQRRFRGSSAWRQQAAVEWHLSDDRLSCEKSKIAAAHQLVYACRPEYPHLTWPDASQVMSVAAKRYAMVQQDVHDHPDDTVNARAKRLMGEFGIGDSQTRKVITAMLDRK